MGLISRVSSRTYRKKSKETLCKTTKMGRRGPKKHLKTLNAPHHWMLSKTAGVFSFRPNAGPHKLRECLPLAVFIRNRLKYALSGKECQKIMMGRMVKVDGKVRTDVKYPAGYMDVITIDKTNVPFLVTHDGRTLRYPNPDVKVGDSIELDIADSKITNWVKFETGNICHVIGGKNVGRIGTIQSRERHPGSFDIVNVKDSAGHTFATRASNIFLLGKGPKPLVSLPRDKGVRKTIAEERDARIQNRMTN